MNKALLLILISFLISCRQSQQDVFYQLVNENFFKIVDTTAYQTGKLVQIPNDTLQQKRAGPFNLLIDTSLNTSDEVVRGLLLMISKRNLSSFKILLQNKSVNISNIDIKKIYNIDKFMIVGTNNSIKKFGDEFVGKVSFLQPFISLNEAIIIFSIYRSSKAGYTEALLFKKVKGTWQPIQSFEIERW